MSSVDHLQQITHSNKFNRLNLTIGKTEQEKGGYIKEQEENHCAVGREESGEHYRVELAKGGKRPMNIGEISWPSNS